MNVFLVNLVSMGVYAFSINFFIATQKSIHGEHVEEERNGFIEYYKKAGGIKQ